MFIKNNQKFAEEIADIIAEINPHEVQLNTPLRPRPIMPLKSDELSKIEKIFLSRDLNTFTVYKSEKPKTKVIDKIELFKRKRSVL